MDTIVKLKRAALLGGDVVVLYLALFLTLLLRYNGISAEVWQTHAMPFTIIFLVWIIVFYVADLYDLRLLKNSIEFTQKLGVILGLCAGIAILFFYFLPGFGIAPKVNLFIFIAFAGALGYAWRTFYNAMLQDRLPVTKLMLLGYNQTAEELSRRLREHPQLGYEVKYWMKEGLRDKEFKQLAEIIAAHKIHLIVVPAHIKKSARAAHLIYKNLAFGTEVVDLATLYERVLKKVPLAELEEVWFLENLTKSHKIYDTLKRPVEVIAATLWIALTLPLLLLFIVVIKATSPGPAIFTQKRVGWRNREFLIYKLRTMRLDAERRGPRWAKPNDERSTSIGRFLRRTHLDELPQFWNIVRGDLSLIGPRPERPEFVESLRKEIPFYELRHLVRPGVSGWAQTHYRYGASIKDAYEKLQYDIYYLKNRSLLVDLLILLKTFKFFFTNL